MKILLKTHLKQLDFYLAKLRLDRYFESGNKENQQYFQIVGIKNQAAWKFNLASLLEWTKPSNHNNKRTYRYTPVTRGEPSSHGTTVKYRILTNLCWQQLWPWWTHFPLLRNLFEPKSLIIITHHEIVFSFPFGDYNHAPRMGGWLNQHLKFPFQSD